MGRAYNFNPGPAILPEPVLRQAAAGVLELDGSGMSILEVSHRASHYRRVHEEAKAGLLRLLDLGEDYTVLFLGGGASLQFTMVPWNYLRAGKTADYVDTGSWALKAIREAQRVGQVNVISSSSESAYTCLPPMGDVTPEACYVHITTNNTIEGTQWPAIPDTGEIPLVADMSSDFLSRRLDHGRFSLIYAGAQKNAGPAGVTVVVIRRSFVDLAADDLPPMLSYKVQAREDSLYNTPPVFGVYVVGLVCKWLEDLGGLEEIERRNAEKAGLVYAALDAYPEVYEPTVSNRSHRSQMNITFRLRDHSRESEFLRGAEERGMVGLKGHRSVGGFRASCYNALPREAAQALADYLEWFAQQAW